jgi:RNA polymerase-interacting CarD/CdnL/TRCF family regulator
VEREVFGTWSTYLKLRLAHGTLVLMVPVASAAQVGLRGVISRDEVTKVFDLLGEDEGWMPVLWNQRFKSNREKLVSGDIYRLAEVVRDLSITDRRKSLAAAEGMLDDVLTEARGPDRQAEGLRASAPSVGTETSRASNRIRKVPAGTTSR